MELLQIILLCSATHLVTCTDPQVQELIQEDSKPPAFDYRTSVQPDRWRYRYAQQQKVDAINLARFMKRPTGYEVPRPIATYEKYHGKASSNDWFQPRILRQSEGGKVMVNLHNVTDRQDMYGQIVYVHPSLLRESNEGRAQPVVYSMKQPNEPAPIVYTMKQTQTQLNALSDLLGKNPNVQLEGLKRLLKQSPSPIRHPQPFQTKNDPKPEAMPKYEKSPVPVPKTPIDKDTLASLQRQFNEASQFRANEVLARAQEQARAHVEAQHKAIAQAQKAIFEKVQIMYHTPQTLPLVQPEGPILVQPEAQVYPTPIPIRVNPTLLQHSTPNPNSITIQDKPHHQTNLKPNVPTYQSNQEPKVEPLLSNPIVVTTNTPEFETEVTTFKPLNPVKSVILSKNNVNYYAPNHLHEAVAHFQAQKTIRSQVKSNNKAILRAQNKGAQGQSNRGQIRHKQKHEQGESAEESAATITHQQVVFNREQEVNEVYDHGQQEEEQYEDGQYASNYAFGYQINDAKEGNDYGHQEKRSGKTLEGSYHVLLPDGRRQKVDYYADDTGYHAKVTYENFAQH